MLRSILVALDGFADSDAAAELGMRWAQAFEAKLVGIGIVDQPSMLTTSPAPQADEDTPDMQGHWKDEQERVASYLQKFCQKSTEKGVSAKVLQDVGPPSARIILEAHRHDIILMSSHFEAQASPGDTLTQVVTSAPRAVVSVPGALPTGSSVIVAFDGSVQASRAMQAFVATGLHRSNVVYIVSIEADADEAALRCKTAREYLQLHDIEAEARPLASTGPPAELLLAEITELDGGLLVIGAHKKPILKEFFLGSVTTTILNKSSIPLFLCH